jgi:endo-1,4-beta-xylanase
MSLVAVSLVTARRAALGLLLPLLVIASCLRKRPAFEPVVPPLAETVSSPLAAPATGRYGQVAGTALLGGEGLHALGLVGKTERASVSFVSVEGQPFNEALRVEIREGSANAWDVQLQTRVGKAVNAGDVLLASFYLRSEAARAESGEGQTEFVMELAREPWTKSVSYPVGAGNDWKHVFVRFTAGQSYAPKEAQVIFRLGYAPETLEIAALEVENFGKQLAVADLPTTKLSYAGMEADAPWRRAAAERIEKLRKAELSLKVRDKAGKALAGAKIELKQTRQAFAFGSAVVAQRLMLPGNERYQALIPELFNTAVLENNFKWQALAGDWGSGWNLDVAKQGVDWLTRHGLATRGHVLVWPSFKNSPRSLRDLKNDRTKLREAVKTHVRELVTEMRGKLLHWDVLNEPFDNHDLMDLLGNDVMVEWFREARAADPSVKLFINDYAILSGGGSETAHRAHYEKTIRFLNEHGAPFDGIGMQGHFGAPLTSPEDLLRILDRFAKLGKPIFVTEYDVDLADEELVGHFTRDFYTLLFSHPAVRGILMWGFWDGAHYRGNAPLYRRDWSLKPAGQAYRDLVLHDFRTNEAGLTDAEGSFKVRGFLGSYELTVNSGGRVTKKTVELTAGTPEQLIVVD